jgi:hypothetical protein
VALAATALLLAGGAVLLWSVGSAQSSPTQISEKDNGRTIRVPVGSTVGMSLRGFAVASGQAPDAWSPPETSDRSVVEVVQDGPGFRLPWDAPVTNATLVPRSPGKAEVTATMRQGRVAVDLRLMLDVSTSGDP